LDEPRQAVHQATSAQGLQANAHALGDRRDGAGLPQAQNADVELLRISVPNEIERHALEAAYVHGQE
jgi:hypothetical protein